MSGKLVVIEGTDGSGKATQTKLLVERLKKEGHSVATLSFPQYGNKSAGLVEEYLNGKYGKPNEVNPYAASLFYAVDRFDVARQIRGLLDEGRIVLLDRYVDSNAGHQGGKISDEKEREIFLEWLYKTEYEILGVPKPDLVLILWLPQEQAQKLIAKKAERKYIEKGTKDAHESDSEHLKNAEKAYWWLVCKREETHKAIVCFNGFTNQIRPQEEVHEMVYQAIKSKQLI